MDKINGAVIKKLEFLRADKMAAMIAQRRQKGIAEYGQDIDAANLTAEEVEQHLIEELLDAAVYAEKLASILEQEGQRELANKIKDLESVIIAQIVKMSYIVESKLK